MNTRLVVVSALAAVAAAGAALAVGTIAPANAVIDSCADGGDCVLGDTGPGGGIVFFVKGTGAFEAHRDFAGPVTVSAALTAQEQADLPFDYLEVAPPTAETLGVWSDTSTDVTAAIGTLIGTGLANSDAIVAAGTSMTGAADQALAYANNGTTDWYLPSADELALILVRQAALSTAMGTFDAQMWSSTQVDMTTGSGLDFASGAPVATSKQTASLGVRPIRGFYATTPSSTTTTAVAGGSSTTTTSIGGGSSTTTDPGSNSSSSVPSSSTTPPTSSTDPATTTATTTAPSTGTTVAPGTGTTVAPGTGTTVSTVATSSTSSTLASSNTVAATSSSLTEADVLALPITSLDVASQVTAGQTVTVRMDFLTPGSAAEVYIASEPVLLGSGVVGSDGTIAISVSIPTSYSGAHSLVLLVPADGVAVRQVVTIAGSGAGLPGTGSNIESLLELAGVLTVIGGLVLAARRRRPVIA